MREWQSQAYAGKEELCKATLLGSARGYCVSTVGLDEVVIRKYIMNQEFEKTPGANKTRKCLTIAPSRGFHHTTRFAGSR